MPLFRFALFCSSIILTLHIASGASAQIARLELLAIPSNTPTDQEFLTGRRDAKAVMVLGELRIPKPGVDKLAAVVLLHGSGGLNSLHDNWARELNALGVATLMVDSFNPRGILGTQADQDQLTRMAQVLDAYRALELLAKHPRIDAARIAVMGFSRGGGAAHWAALKRFYAMHGPTSGLSFAGHIAFYPTCNRVFANADETTGKPIRIHHGTADDYIPIGGCRSYVERLKKAGADIALIEYADAHHVFDSPALATPVKLGQAQTTRNCPPIEEWPDGRLVNSKTKAPFTYATDPCVERGTTVAFNPTAHATSLTAVKAFVRELLQP
jgi:dienelactone hydrolase